MVPPANQSSDAPIDDDAELYALEKLLSADDGTGEGQTEKSEPAPAAFTPRLREDSTFAETFSYDVIEPPPNKQKEAAAVSLNKLDDLDSSDDEEVKNFLERKYNEYGSDINKKLKQQRETKHEEAVARDVAFLEKTPSEEVSATRYSPNGLHIKNLHNPIQRRSLVSSSFKKAPPPSARNEPTAQIGKASSSTQPSVAAKPFNTLTDGCAVFTDPVFGLRIVNPLVSSAVLIERMSARKAVPFSGVAFHTQRGDLSKDWVIAGVVVHKFPVKTSKKGDPYSIWRLSDLKGDIKMVSLFLFKGAHKELWKTSTGTCLAILNPTVFEKRAESGDVACLSIDTSQKVMILGQSKDLGVCKAKKKNGDACTAIVNVGDCDYCVYHMKQEFGRMSNRSELQSATAGRGLNELRNKVLGKSEVFYGGKSFSAIPAKKNAKQVAKDSNRLMALSEYATSPNAGSINHPARQKSSSTTAVPYAARGGPVSRLAANVESSTKQRLKDMERLKILQAESELQGENATGNKGTEYGSKQLKPHSASDENALKNRPTSSTSSKQETTTANGATSVLPAPDKFKDRSFSFASPKLSQESFSIEINIGDRKAQLAKLNAMQILKKKPIEKVDPNSIRGTKTGKKRALEDLNDRFDVASKRHKSEQNERENERENERKTRIQRIMDAASSHANLINMREQQEQDKYFSKLEKKEALEEKMLNTYKVPCKAVICQQCKYTAFSAADRCKTENHPLKVIDAEKRFFQCKDCGNRTVTVFKLPKTSCKNCTSSRWQRAAMIKERMICDGSEGLSVRGDEETFIGSLAGKANLNLLVPDE